MSSSTILRLISEGKLPAFRACHRRYRIICTALATHLNVKPPVLRPVPALVSLSTAAFYFQLSRATLYRAVRNQRLPVRTVRGHARVELATAQRVLLIPVESE